MSMKNPCIPYFDADWTMQMKMCLRSVQNQFDEAMANYFNKVGIRAYAQSRMD